MKRRLAFLSLVVTVVLVLSVASWAVAQDGTGGSDTDPNTVPEVVIPEKYRLPAGESAPQLANATIYFATQDNNYNTTVIFLYNTTNSSGIVTIAGFRLDGTQSLSTSVVVPAKNLVRICADTILNPPTSWLDTILVNLKDDTAYAKLGVPAGLKVDAFVVWDGVEGYDPNVGAYTVPVRFSSDPATVFMPAALRDYP
jgi:hypothetical protein